MFDYDEIFDDSINEGEVSEIMPQDLNLDVVFEDENFAVVNKPKGMVVHVDHKHREGTLVNGLLYRFDNLCNRDSDRPGIVHRLDKDTSGAILICKNDATYEIMKERFKNREVYKEYWVVVRGGFSVPKGKIDAPIGRNPRDRKLMLCNAPPAREALTEYEVIEKFGEFSLVKCILHTGRTHQIRVHMKHIKHTVLGDKQYGTKLDLKMTTGQFLHAKKVGFKSLDTGEYVEYEAQLPEYFKTFLAKHGYII